MDVWHVKILVIALVVTKACWYNQDGLKLYVSQRAMLDIQILAMHASYK